MSDTVHNWDIDALRAIQSEIQRLGGVLAENKDLLVSEGFELLQDWQGRAGRKMLLVTAANAQTLDDLVKGFSELYERLDDVINKCYEPCENEIRANISKLLQ